MNEILQGHAPIVLKTIGDESIDCCITSPPYWGLRDYKSSPQVWDGSPDCNHEWGENILPRFSKSGPHGPNATIGTAQAKAQDDTGRGEGTNFCVKCGAWRGELGLEPTAELYTDHLLKIFNQVKRVLKPEGTCWINLGDTYANAGEEYQDKCLCMIPYHFAIGMIRQGWILRNVLVWYKRNCMPASVNDRFTVDFEPIFFFVKNKEYWFEQQYEKSNDPADDVRRIMKSKDYARDRQGGNAAFTQEQRDIDKVVARMSMGRNRRCVWDVLTKPFADAHFAVFPEELAEIMIRSGCPQWICKRCNKARVRIVEPGERIETGGSRQKDTPGISNKAINTGYRPKIAIGYTDCGCATGYNTGVVLDPFVGSGTTAIVAKKTGRNYVGIELNPEYVAMAQERLKETKRPL